MEVVRVRLCSEKTKGCEKAPISVIKSLRDIKNKENGKEICVDELRLEEIHVDLNMESEADNLIFENSKEILERNFKSFFIGGDQSISFPILRAFEKIDRGFLIVFDSCGDCGVKGDSNRIWLRRLIESGFSGKRIVLVGVRAFDSEEKSFLKENGVVSIGMDILQEDLSGVCDLIMERARESDGFYISLDMKVVDPCCAPGVSEIYPGGLSSREIIYLVKRLSLLNNFRGADITEINTEKDINELTSRLGAKLLSEMI